jgi:hypothetical protein
MPIYVTLLKFTDQGVRSWLSMRIARGPGQETFAKIASISAAVKVRIVWIVTCPASPCSRPMPFLSFRPALPRQPLRRVAPRAVFNSIA